MAALCASLALHNNARGAEGALNDDDQKFVKMAAQSSMAEVQFGMLGARKAAPEEVKALAEKIQQDHTAMNEELKQLAQAKNVMLSQVTDPDATKDMKDLENKATGGDFAKAWLQEMDERHGKAITSFDAAIANSKDADVKAWAEKHLPHLKAHHEQIKALRQKYP